QTHSSRNYLISKLRPLPTLPEQPSRNNHRFNTTKNVVVLNLHVLYSVVDYPLVGHEIPNAAIVNPYAIICDLIVFDFSALMFK
ncbi:MAG: hypothetical protein ACREBU_07345, partial [Nitrososphaera sp.]